ncbi:MAG: radical SAM protein, partial [Clostridia bacterium]|nr:radical SAM protein [Clostridia bacterium]
IIPYVRGPIRSQPLAEIRSEACRLVGAGFREIVVTGIHLTSYGTERRDGTGLADALAAVQESGISRIRLGSLEPVIITDEFLAKLSEMPAVCHQFHLSLQSGSDTVLSRMHRRYTTAEYLNACTRIRETFSDATITTDIMTGFPGETEQEFAESLEFCKTVRFARMHVFPYSERDGTVAAGMPNSVPRAIREERARKLIAVGAILEKAEMERQIGEQATVLVEEVHDRYGEGYTGPYMRIRVPDAREGELIPVRITGLSQGCLTGVRV